MAQPKTLRRMLFAAALAAALTLSAIVTAKSSEQFTGEASWYGTETCAGKAVCRTANGETFQPGGYTAAHRSLPFGTVVTVINLHNGQAIAVRINDRGPAAWTGRVIDLSHGAAKAIGMVRRGTAQVRVIVP